jgi:hypothetical protein
MKYKHIKSAIHNFGFSFISDENYVDDDYVFFDLANIHSQGHDITIDWLNSEFKPSNLCTERIQKSIGYWVNMLNTLLKSQNVEPESLKSLYFIWPANDVHYMFAVDDRGVEYKKEVRYAS